MPHSRNDGLEAFLHRLAAILPVESHLLPVLYRCGCGLCGASSVLCIPASPLACKAAITDGLVLAHARQVGLVTLVLAPVACLALDEPEASHVDPVLLAQLFGHCEGGLGRGCGRGHLCGVHGARGGRRWGGRRWAGCLALPDNWGARLHQFFLRAHLLLSLTWHTARATDIKKRQKEGARVRVLLLGDLTISRRPPRSTVCHQPPTLFQLRAPFVQIFFIVESARNLVCVRAEGRAGARKPLSNFFKK